MSVAKRRYALTDADGDVIPGEEYHDEDAALDARAVLMSQHPDGDQVTVKDRKEDDDG